ncbi:MAG: hypothetical protein U1E39_05280 [Planctomycetota bacterium]
MASGSPLQRATFAVSVLTLGVAGFAILRTPATPAGSNGPSAAPPPASGIVTDAGSIRDGGSFYYGRTANRLTPPTRIDGGLFSDRVDECTNGCPVGMRMIEGPEAFAQGVNAVQSVGSTLDVLAAAAADVVPAFAETARAVRAEQVVWSTPRAPRTRRVFSLGMPRPDYGEDAAMVVYCAYDHCDPIFDANRVEDCPSGGSHVLVARIERTTPEGRTIVAGLVEVEVRPTPATPGAEVSAGPAAMPVMMVVAPVYMHFGAGRRGRVQGLFLDANGAIFSFGADRAPQPVAATPGLRLALERVLKRA